MDLGLLQYVGLAFLGGVILNLMPCVLPVLTMKVFHVIEHAGASPRQSRLHGLAYSGGILATFLLFALVIIGLRASGDTIGWGMQFQSPAFVAGMTALIFAFGLNALGVFEFTISVQGVGGGDGYGASFVNGIVASIMSTPCSAPFLGSAAAFALGSGAAWWETLVLFLCIGLGLASPFLLVSFVPWFGRKLPRPGAWMESFKMLMGFSLLATAVWLFGVLQAQVARESSTLFLFFLLALGFGLWSVDHFGGLERSAARRMFVRAVAAGFVVSFGMKVIDLRPAPQGQPEGFAASDAGAPVVIDDRINWAPFSAARVASEGQRQRPVFVDFTADWCANCKANERLFIETQPIRDLLVETDILPMKADMTNEDEALEDALGKLGRSGIPAYVILFPDGSHDLLPEAITTKLLIERLQAAAQRYPVSARKKPAAATSAAASIAPSFHPADPAAATCCG